ncbi:hypothetical protein D3C75_789460 [compost metagenome]
MKSRVPQELVFPLPPDIFHPALHAWVLLLEDTLIPIALVQRPGTDNGCIAPGRRGMLLVPQDIRNHERNTAMVQLVGRQIFEPFGEKRRHIHQIRRSPDEHLRIPGPAQPLIPLRAIRRHIDKVAFLAPQDIVLELVDQRIGAREGACVLHIRMKYDPCKILWREFLTEPGQLHIPEPLEGKTRLIAFPANAFGNIGDLLSGASQIIGVDVAVPVQHLEMNQLHLPPARGIQAELHPANHVLPHIKHGFTGWRLNQLKRLDLFYFSYRNILLRHQNLLRMRDEFNPGPAAAVIPGLAEPAQLQTGIIGLSVIELRH